MRRPRFQLIQLPYGGDVTGELSLIVWQTRSAVSMMAYAYVERRTPSCRCVCFWLCIPRSPCCPGTHPLAASHRIDNVAVDVQLACVDSTERIHFLSRYWRFLCSTRPRAVCQQNNRAMSGITNWLNKHFPLPAIRKPRPTHARPRLGWRQKTRRECSSTWNSDARPSCVLFASRLGLQ